MIADNPRAEFMSELPRLAIGQRVLVERGAASEFAEITAKFDASAEARFDDGVSKQIREIEWR